MSAPAAQERDVAGANAAAGGDRILEVREIRKRFGGFTAVGGVSLSMAPREIVAIIGPNGAGKSTFFNLVTGHLVPDDGVVRFEGRDITGWQPHTICRLGMGRSFQRINIFPKLTVFQNVQAAIIAHRGQGTRLWGRSAGLFRDDTMALLESIGLADLADETSGHLSYGAQKQIELGIALASEPRLLLLDEPTAGMSARETHDAIRLIERIAAERSLSLLFTEHDMAVVFSIAQRIAVLHQGRLIAEGPPAQVRADAEVRRIYLGAQK
ncbi:MAG TPA: ABC transporter ATP-binding protein [Burkholderiaceae bacterium]|nr:ABC transporter ATP-binding protein [Burkholderiaceae bacterium]